MKPCLKLVIVYAVLLSLGAVLYIGLARLLGQTGFWLACGMAGLVATAFTLYALRKP